MAATRVPRPPRRRRQPEEEGKVLTILEHLQELRRRLTVAAGTLVVAVIGSFFITNRFMKLLTQPAKDAHSGLIFIAIDPTENIATYFKVSLLLGVAIAMPVILYEVLAFIAPGLTRNEKRWVYPIVLGASAAFIGGCFFAYFIEMPPALKFLYNFNSDVAQPQPRLGPYINFVTRLILATGLVFEMPLFVMGLAKLGLVTSRRLLHWWRYAIVGAFILSAIVTPSIDPVTQTVVAAPIIILYFLGIILARLVESRPILAGLAQR